MVRNLFVDRVVESKASDADGGDVRMNKKEELA